MSAEQQQYDDLPTLEVPTGMFDFAAAGWSDKLAELRSEAARIPKCTVSLFSRVRVDDAIASPEALDKQTDMLMRDILPPSELIKTKSVKKASELTEAEFIGVCDTLLSYFAQFARGTPANVSVETCFYAHMRSYVEGHPLAGFLDMLLKAMVHVSHIVDMSGVRDGDEEFSSSFLAGSIGGAMSASIDMEMELVEKEAAKKGPLADRFKLLLAIGQYTNSGIKLIRDGAQTPTKEGSKVTPKDELAAAAKAIAAAAATITAAHAADAVATPLATVFTPHAAMWDTMGIPHVAVDPCAWGDAMAFYQDIAADATLIIEKWFPIRHDLLAVLEAVKAYAFRASAPTLLARATAASFAIHGHHPFGGEPLLPSMLALLASRFGAPWYAAVAHARTKEDKALCSSIVEYAQEAGAQPGRPGPSVDETRRFIVVGTSTTIMETGRIVAQLIIAYLRNPGRCHRVLINMLPQIQQCQHQVLQVERRAFSFSGMTAFSQANASVMPRNEVLLALVSDLLLDTCLSICLLTQRLTLLTEPELPSLMVYYQQIASSRAENLAVLHTSDGAIKEFAEHVRRRATPPILATRRATTQPLGPTVRLELTLMFTRALCWSLNALKAKMPALAMPEKSLQPLSQIFDHRFSALQQNVSRPAILTFKDVQEYMRIPDVTKTVDAAVDHFKVLAQRIPATRDKINDPSLAGFFDAVEKASKKNAVTVGLVHKVPGYTVQLVHNVEFPFVVTLNAVKTDAAATTA